MSSLFREAYEITKRKQRTLYSLALITLLIWIPFVLIVGMFTGGGYVLAGSNGLFAGGAVSIIMLILFFVLCLRLEIAMYEAIIENHTVSSAFQASQGKILRFFGTSLLSGLIVGLGFVLLVIPGVVFSVWYAFAQLIVLRENLSGMDALRQSKGYVKGRWMAVAARLAAVVLLVWVVVGVLNLVLRAFFDKSAAKTVSDVVSFLLVPFIQVYIYLLYKNLRETMPSEPAESSVMPTQS